MQDEKIAKWVLLWPDKAKVTVLDNPLSSDLNKEEQMSEDVNLLNLNFKVILQISLYF